MSRFAPRRREDVASAIREEVLGLITTHDEQGFISTPLPLLAELDDAGEVRTLIGHFAKANPHVARAMAISQAQISFFGPHGYISPSMVSKPDWGPTWNYRLIQFEVEIEFQPGQEDQAIRALAAVIEGTGENSWRVEKMGQRYAGLVENVIAFRARVTQSSARFKLGQDEDATTFQEILDAMGDTPLSQAMYDQRE